jgi:hypothetical protein
MAAMALAASSTAVPIEKSCFIDGLTTEVSVPGLFNFCFPDSQANRDHRPLQETRN